MSSRNPVLVFLHVPKAAGTTLVSIIEQEFGAASICRFRHASPLEAQVDEINRSSATAQGGCRIITGHVGYGLHKYLEQPVSYFTMLREPVSLLVSRYHYRRSHPRQHPVLARHAKTSSLVQFANTIEDNTMTRFLSGAELGAQVSLGPEHSSFQALQIARVSDGGFAGDPPCTRDMLERAKLNLRENCSAFGTTERFDECILLFAEAFGWKRIHYKKRNIGRPEVRHDPPTAAELAALKHRNALDLELYEYACRLLDGRIAERGPQFRKSVDRFKAANALRGRLNAWQTAVERAPGSVMRALRRIKNRP